MLSETEEAPADLRSEPYGLRYVGPGEWVVYDRRIPGDDARCVIAHVSETDGQYVEVLWLAASSRPTRYVSAAAVVADLRVPASGRPGGTRPIEIPHFAPLPER